MFCPIGLGNIFTYSGSESDTILNWTTWGVLLLILINVLANAKNVASRYQALATAFWVPFSVVLFGLQILACCAADETGISAVWSAYGGFLFFSYFLARDLFKSWQARASTAAALLLWLAVLVYYAVVEAPLTTIAHLVAFLVGGGGAYVFKVVHGCGSRSRSGSQLANGERRPVMEGGSGSAASGTGLLADTASSSLAKS